MCVLFHPPLIPIREGLEGVRIHHVLVVNQLVFFLVGPWWTIGILGCSSRFWMVWAQQWCVLRQTPVGKSSLPAHCFWGLQNWHIPSPDYWVWCLGLKSPLYLCGSCTRSFLDLRRQIPLYGRLAAIRPSSLPDNLPVVAWAFPGRKGTRLSPCLCTVLALVRCREHHRV